MKRVLRTLTVTTLTSCLTTLQFTAAWAQSYEAPMETRVKRSQVMPKRTKSVLATPIMMTAPQSGAQADLSYHYKTMSLTTKGLNKRTVLQSGHEGFASVAAALNPNFFLGVKASFKSITTEAEYLNQKSSSKAQGEAEPTLFAGARLDAGPVSTLVGLDYNIGIGDRVREKADSAEGEENGKLGGSSFTPEIAVFTNQKSSMIFGGRFAYTIRQERNEVERYSLGQSMEGKIEGGNTMSLTSFIETPQMGHSLGAAIAYIKSEDESTRLANGVATTSKGPEIVSVMVYGNIKASSMLAFQPSLGYNHFLNDRFSDTELSKQSYFNGMLNARLTF